MANLRIVSLRFPPTRAEKFQSSLIFMLRFLHVDLLTISELCNALGAWVLGTLQRNAKIK